MGGQERSLDTVEADVMISKEEKENIRFPVLILVKKKVPKDRNQEDSRRWTVDGVQYGKDAPLTPWVK